MENKNMTYIDMNRPSWVNGTNPPWNTDTTGNSFPTLDDLLKKNKDLEDPEFRFLRTDTGVGINGMPVFELSYITVGDIKPTVKIVNNRKVQISNGDKTLTYELDKDYESYGSCQLQYGILTIFLSEVKRKDNIENVDIQYME